MPIANVGEDWDALRAFFVGFEMDVRQKKLTQTITMYVI
jgi:hypothetical protein